MMASKEEQKSSKSSPEESFWTLYCNLFASKGEDDFRYIQSVLSTCLLFNAIFTAVVSATLTSAIQPDYGSVTVSILEHISSQLSGEANSSYTHQNKPYGTVMNRNIGIFFYPPLALSILSSAISLWYLPALDQYTTHYRREEANQLAWRVHAYNSYLKTSHILRMTDFVLFSTFFSLGLYFGVSITWLSTTLGAASSFRGAVVSLIIGLVIYIGLARSKGKSGNQSLPILRSIVAFNPYQMVVWSTIFDSITRLDAHSSSFKQLGPVLDLIDLHDLKNYVPDMTFVSRATLYSRGTWKKTQSILFSNKHRNLSDHDWKEMGEVVGKLVRAFHNGGAEATSARPHFQQEFHSLEQVETLSEQSLDQCVQMVQWGLLSPEPDQHFGPVERLLKGEMGESEPSKVELDRELIPLALHYLDLQPSERSDLWSRYLVAFSISITIPYESLTSVKALSDEGLETGLHIFHHQLAIYNSPTNSLLLDDLSELEINAIKEFGSSLISQYTTKLATSATVGSMNQALGYLLSLLDEYPMTREDRFKHHATCAYPTHRLRKVSLIPRIHEVLKQVVLAKEKHPEWVISPTVEEATSDEAPVKRSKRLIEPIGSKDEEWIHLDVGSTSSSIQEQVVGRSWIDSIDEIVEMVHIFDMLLQNGCSEDEHMMLIKLLIQHLGSYSTSFIRRRISRKELAFLSLIQDASLRLIASRISNVSYPDFNIPGAGSQLWASGAWKTAVEYWLQSHNGTLTYLDRILFANGLLQGNSDVHTLLINATLIHPQLQAQVIFILEYDDPHPRDGILETITRCLHVRNAPWFQETMEAEDRFDGILEKITELTPLDRIRLLPLLSTLMDSIGGIPSRMIAITDIIHSTLAIEHSVLLQQDEVDEVAQRLEHLPVAALQAIRSLEMSDPIQARAVLTRVDRIIRMLREAEDVHRALTQWNSARSSCFQEF